jgi:hypothetical protein
MFTLSCPLRFSHIHYRHAQTVLPQLILSDVPGYPTSHAFKCNVTLIKINFAIIVTFYWESNKRVTELISLPTTVLPKPYSSKYLCLRCMTSKFYLGTHCQLCVISGFGREVVENCALLGYYAAIIGNFLPTFRDYVLVPRKRYYSRKRFNCHLLYLVFFGQ